MRAILAKLNKALDCIIEILVFIFLRKPLIKHVKFLVGVFLISLVIGVSLGLSIRFGFISLNSELPSFISWPLNFYLSFLDIEKLYYVGLTYIISLIAFFFSSYISEHHNKNNKTQLDMLEIELKINSRAALIIMSSTLSLTLKVLIGVCALLFSIDFAGGGDIFNDASAQSPELLYSCVTFLFFDIVIFIVLKFMILPIKEIIKNPNPFLKN